MAVPGQTPKPGPAAFPSRPTPGEDQTARAGGAVDPDLLRRRVGEVLEAPAPTLNERVEQMERAHALLQDALGGEGSFRG